MGFWASLGKIASVAGPIAASFIPGGGAAASLGSKIAKGALSAAPVVGGIGDAANGALAGKKAGETSAAELNLKRDQLAASGARDFEQANENRGTLELDRKKQEQAGQADAMRKILQSALISNYKPGSAIAPEGVNVTHFNSPTIGSFGTQGKAAADELGRQAMSHLVNGEGFTSLPTNTQYVPTELPKSDTMDKILGGASILGSAAKMARLFQKPTTGSTPFVPPVGLSKVPAKLPGQLVNTPQNPFPGVSTDTDEGQF